MEHDWKHLKEEKKIITNKKVINKKSLNEKKK
jgi:hypothetical protein